MSAARILVVDDEPDVEALVSQRFRRRIRAGELDFRFARDGQEALETLMVDPDFDIVLSDINMPRMDGLTLLDRLGALGHEAKTVIVSAYGDMRNIRIAMNRGAFDFVTKPIEFQDLEATLEKTLEHQILMRRLREEKRVAEQTAATLARYFSPGVVAALSAQPDCLTPHGEWREATFLFTDLADFTPLAEALEPGGLVSLLNAYLEGLTEIVFAHGGTVMKIIGDSVQAIFGAPVEDAAHADQGITCALAIDRFARDFEAEQRGRGIALGATRIGVNTGHAVIGNFGGARFFDYTAFGDAVNVAARLEGANKIVGTRICVSESVVEHTTAFAGRPIGALLLRGKSRSLRCYEPLGPGGCDEAAVARYAEAFALLEAGDARARQAFAGLVGADDTDPLPLFHLGRLLGGHTGCEIMLGEI
ncbi:response regulator [Limibaculum sp. FT325]|uniref:adenylate/guanylate cyclase domain-containing protein n=1 Tax=Thermohalobaculum sediminis TaxID=2939436 RepID=UPI0020BDB71B|nr:adenylate/guanylate cyclase domain-containing protein [Limibaculum sediminis]MCL5776414.1 response regulator [Limibaculum sediminis]